MFSNRVAFVAVSIACVGAAAGGSYLATRQSQASSAMAATAPAAAPAPAATSAGTPAAPPALADATPGASSSIAPVAPPAAAPEKSHAMAASTQGDSKNKKTPVATMAKNMPSAAGARTSAQSVQTPPSAPMPDTTPMPAPVPDSGARQDDIRPPEPPKIVEPERAPEKTFDELVVSADSVIGVQLETALSSEHSKVEDRVDARVIRDVRVGSHVAIPAGAHLIGSVMIVERGSKFKDRARLGIRFNTLVLADGMRVPVTTEMIYRYGEPPSNSSASKIGGGAVIGTILGGILGGGKGAAVGAAAGAGGGAVAAANADRSAAEFPAGMQMTARFLAPVAVTVER